MKTDTEDAKALHIIDMRAENLMRLVAVHIRPDGSMINISGRNGQGKTSTIRAIAWALGGKDFAVAMPLRQGETVGYCSIDLGRLKVTKRVERVGDDVRPSLVLEYPDGSRPKSPQAVLDELRGQLMNPIAFLQAKPAQRIETVKELFHDFDFAAHERDRKQTFEERTIVNREHKRAEAARDALVLPKGSAPRAVDVGALSAKLREANAANEMTGRRKAGREAAQREFEDKRNRAERLRAEARELDKQADALEAKLEAAEPLPELIDIKPILGEIERASATNAAVAKHEEWARLDHAVIIAKAAAAALTIKLDTLDAAKAEALAGGKLPFPGLAFGEEDVEIDGVPWDQVAFSTRLRASAAMAIALQPKLHVMLISEYGSLLDADSMALLKQIADEHDFQVWIETVGGGGQGKVLIEDGRVVA